MAGGDEEAAGTGSEDAPATEAAEAVEVEGGGDEAESKSSKGKKKKKTKEKSEKEGTAKDKKKRKGDKKDKKKKKSSGEAAESGTADADVDGEAPDGTEGEAEEKKKKAKGSKEKKKKKGEKKEGEKKEKSKKKKPSKESLEDGGGGEGSGGTENGVDPSAESSAPESELKAVSEEAGVSGEADASGDAESIGSEQERMMDLLQQWDEESESSSEEEEEESSEEEEEVDIPLYTSDDEIEDNMIDHIILASPNIEEAVNAFEAMTGIKPKICGGLAGLGVIAARVALDNRAYIEIIGPDLKRSGSLGAKLFDLEEGTLAPFHFAVRLSDLSELRDEYIPNELGFEPDHLNMVGKDKSGESTSWEMMFMHGHFFGGLVPYYVNWGKCVHPTNNIPIVGPLKSFTIKAPGGKVFEILKDVENITIENGEPSMEVVIGTPKGTVAFSALSPEGITLPGKGT